MKNIFLKALTSCESFSQKAVFVILMISTKEFHLFLLGTNLTKVESKYMASSKKLKYMPGLNYMELISFNHNDFPLPTILFN